MSTSNKQKPNSNPSAGSAKLPVSRSYDEWIADLVKIMKQYPMLHNRWRTSKFKKLHKEGWTVRNAFRIWFLSHS